MWPYYPSYPCRYPYDRYCRDPYIHPYYDRRDDFYLSQIQSINQRLVNYGSMSGYAGQQYAVNNIYR